MNKNSWLKVVNPILLISFSLQAFTGITLFFIRKIKFLWKMHEFNGVLLVIIIGVHITLNWSWFKSAFSRKSEAL